MSDTGANKGRKPSGAENRKRKNAALQMVTDTWAKFKRDTGPEKIPAYSEDPEQKPEASELPVYGVPPTTLVRDVSNAIAQLEQGMFMSAAYLCDGMFRDDRISGVWSVRAGGLLGSRLKLEPAEDDKEARRIQEEVEKKISEALPIPEIDLLLRYANFMSVGIAQRLTMRTLKSSTPTLRVWNNRYLRFDWLTRCYHMVTENRSEIPIEYGDPEWVIYEPFGHYGWLHGALMRPLVRPWLIRYWTYTWWARRQEVHGQPIRLGIIPPDREPRDERLFLTQLSNLAHEAVIRLPQGVDGNKFDVRLLEAQSQDWEGFQKLLECCDDSIAILLLGQRQSTSGQGGLGSQEKAGDSVRVDLKRRDALIANPLRDQHLKPWIAEDYGDEDNTPFLNWQVEQSEDLAKKALQVSTLADAVLKFQQASAPVDLRALLEGFNMPLLEEAPVVVPAENVSTVSAAPASSMAATNSEQPAGISGAAPGVAETGPAESAAATATLAITATDLASIVRVDEGRKSVGLAPVGGDVGGKWIREHAAELASELPEEVPGGKPSGEPAEEAEEAEEPKEEPEEKPED